MNLVVNAAQAIPEGDVDGHWIRVTSATTPDGRVAVEVSDNGAGMEAHDLDHIFEPFFTTKGDGTGLGLAIWRSIVSGLGGEIEVDSERGRGSRFRVLLPADA